MPSTELICAVDINVGLIEIAQSAIIVPTAVGPIAAVGLRGRRTRCFVCQAIGQTPNLDHLNTPEVFSWLPYSSRTKRLRTNPLDR